MSEWSVPQIMPQGYRFRQILVQPQRPRNGAGNAGNFQRMRKPRPIVISLRLQKDLRLVLKSPKGFGMRNPVNIPLEAGPDLVRIFR